MKLLVNSLSRSSIAAGFLITTASTSDIPFNFRKLSSVVLELYSIISSSVTINKQAKFFNVKTMGKTAGGFYAVARGRSAGIYHTWGDCKAQVNGFPNARFKKFPTQQEAETFISENKTSLPIKRSEGTNCTTKTSTNSSGFHYQQSSTIFTLPHHIPVKAASIPAKTGNREFSTSSGLNKRAALRVNEDRITGVKRAKLDINAGADLSKFSVDEDGYVVVFTDGACKANGKRGAKAGIGIWFGENHHLNISEPVQGRHTNNTAEIQAAERAILQAKKNGIDKLKLMTDSQFTINCVTKWMENWKRKGWKLSNGHDVKNREDLIKLDNAIKNIEIKWSYVAGHSGHHGNEEADRLAVLGSLMN